MLPAIERLIVSLVAAVEAALIDAHELRVGRFPAAGDAHMEATMQRLDRRTMVLERTIVDLQKKADHAMELLPDPEVDNRMVLEKTKDAIAGA